jgi:hypothetical protein
MLKKIKEEKLLYLLIILNPIFDLLSSFIKFDTFSLSTILRPIISILLIAWIFIKDKKIRIPLLVISFIYLIYIFIHMMIYKNLINEFSYGTFIHELQYLFNYTYLIFTLLLFVYLFYNKKTDEIKNSLTYAILIYIISIYIAIITNTSLYTYSEGIGYKGWFNTGGAIGSVLIISLFILLPYIFNNFKKHNILKYIFLALIIFYLMFLLGTRVGLYGTIIVFIIYFVTSMLFNYFKKNKFISKKNVLIFLIIIAITLGIIFAYGSSTLKRRDYLNDLKDDIKDNTTKDNIHIAYDLLVIKQKIDNNQIAENYMSKDQKQALVSLYNYGEKYKIPNVDLRRQQMVYHYYLWQNQQDIMLKFFGNGYLTNFGALTLEMEYPALLFNFGFIGLILYGLPFIMIFIYGCYISIKNIKKIDIEMIMYLSGSAMCYLISTLAGHTFFNTSVMIPIIIIHTLIINKIYYMKAGE